MRAHAGSTLRTAWKFAWVALAMLLVGACSSASAPNDTTVATSAPVANPTQAPTATPVATRTTTAVSTTPQLTTLRNAPNYEPCPDGNPDACMSSGTYRLGSDVVPTAVSQVVIPGGWFEWDMGPGTEGILVERSDAKDGSGWGVLFSSIGLVSRDPCDAAKGTFPAGSTSTVDGLIAAMKSWPGFQVGTPQSVTVGGVPGKQVAATSTETTATCPAPVIWQTPQGTGFNGYPMVGVHPKGYTATFQLVDVDGKVLAIRMTDFPQTTQTELGQGVASDPSRHAADQRTLHAILDSLRFG
jgi:hypothetical protein